MAECLIEGDFSRRRLPARGCNLGGDSLLSKAFHHALDGTLRRRDECSAPTGLGVREQLRHHRIDFFDVTARGRTRFKVQRQRISLIGDKHPVGAKVHCGRPAFSQEASKDS